MVVCVCVVKGRPKCSQQEVQQDGPLMSIPSVVEGLFLIRFFCREDKNQILKNVWNFILIKNKKGDAVTISERYFVVLDTAVDKETVEYILARPTTMGSVLLSGKVLQIGDVITRAVKTKKQQISPKGFNYFPSW